MFQGTVTGKVSSILSRGSTTDTAPPFEFYLIEDFYVDKLKFQRVWFVSCPKWMIKTADKMVQQGKSIGINFKQLRPDSYKSSDGQVRPCIAIEAGELFWL